MSAVRTLTGERLSSVVLTPMPRDVDRRLLERTRPRRVRPLAEPPAGSGLLPVPGDAGPPVLGHTLSYIRYGHAFTRARHAALGPVSWCGFVGEHVVIAAGPDATHAVLTNPEKAYSQDGWRFLVDDFFHRGLMLLDGDDHRVHRHVMQEAFTADRVRGYVDRTVPVLRETIPAWPTGRQVRIHPMLKRLTLDVATRVFMDGRLRAGVRGGQRRVHGVRAGGERHRAARSARHPLPRGAAGARPARAVLHRGAAGQAGGRRRRPVLRALPGPHARGRGVQRRRRRQPHDLPDDGGARHLDDHQRPLPTTSAANPEWQERAREESLALGDAPPDAAALQSLRTLDLVMKESLRLAAPVPVVMRRTVRDTALLGHHLPAGQLVMVAGAVNHHDPAIWTDPDTFDPERFAEPRREDRAHRDAWIPFGCGVHKCLGMLFGSLEVTAILHGLLRHHRITVAPGYEPRWDNTSLPVPADGLPLRLEPLALNGLREWNCGL